MEDEFDPDAYLQETAEPDDALPANAAPTSAEFDPDAYIKSFDPDKYLAAATPEFDPDAYIKSFDPDKYLAGQKPQAEGELATAGREAAHSVVPGLAGLAGMGAGAAYGAGVGSALGPVGTVGGGIVGGIVGALATSVPVGIAQEAALKAAGFDDSAQRQANKEENPWSSIGGGIAGGMVGMSPSAAASKLAPVANQLIQRVAGGALGGALEGGQQAVNGEFDARALAANVAAGAAFPGVNKFGEKFTNAGARFVPGRPDTASPTKAVDTADAAVSQSPSVAGNNALAQQPAADPKAPIGQENSKAQGPENYAKKKVAVDNSPFAAEPKDTGLSQGDVTTDKTMMAALAPEPVKGQVVDTGIVEAAQQQSSPLHKQQAIQMNGEIQRQYPDGKMPADVRARFNDNVRIIRGGQPQATLAPEPVVSDRRAAQELNGNYTGEKLPALSPEGQQKLQDMKAQFAEERAADPNLAPVEETYTPEQQAANLARIEARKGATLAPEPAAVAPTNIEAKFAAEDAARAAREAELKKLGSDHANYAHDQRGDYEDARSSFEDNLRDTMAEQHRDATPNEIDMVVDAYNKRWDEHVNPAPIIAKTKDGLARQTAKAQADMIKKLRESGKIELADRYEALSPEERQAIHADLANGLRDRESKAGSLRNKLGAETKNAAQRDQHNKAIDSVQKAFDAHPPKDNETGAELVERLRAAVHAANEAHGGNPLSRKGGYLPRAMPESFQWLRLVQQNALRNPAYWTNEKLAAFKAEEENLRSSIDKSEYPTKNPELMDAGIEMNRRGGGDVAERLGETRGVESHEDAVLDSSNLVHATKATAELGEYFRGERDHEALSPKARKTLDAMPKDVRKAAFDAGEEGADPALDTKVTDWFREHFGESKVDTHEQETDSKPRMTPVTDAKTLASLKPKMKLIDATTPEGAAEVAAVFDKQKKPKYDFEGKEIKGSEIDEATKAKYLKMAEEAAAKAKSRAAPGKSYIKGEKYKDEVKDLTGKLLRDEHGGVPFDKIEAGVKSLIARLRKEANPPGKKGQVYDSAFEVGPHLTSYIAKAPYSEGNNAGRRVADRMNIVAKTDNMIRVEALQEQKAINDALRPQSKGERFKEKAKNKFNQIKGKDQEVAPDLADARAKSRQMYDALESKDASKIKDDATRELFETQILPKQLETEFIRATIREQFPEAKIGRDTEDGVHRIAVNGGPRETVETIGTNADPVAGNDPLSTSRKSAMMERPFVVLEGVQSGQRTVVHMASDAQGKFTGDFTAWVGHKPIDVDAPALEFELGGIYEMGGRKFKMRDATTDEIEANARGSDGKPMQYKRDIAASVVSANAYHRQLLNHLQAIEDLKSSPEFRDFATMGKDAPAGWVESTTPGFEKYKMDPHLRDALRDAYQPGVNDDALNVARNISRAVTKTIFWNPIVHQLNVGYHWVVERGFKWVPGSGGYRDLAETGAMAIKSVIKQDKLQQVLAEHGAGNIYGGVYSEAAHQKLGLALGEIIAKEPHKWGPVAKTLDMSVGDLVRSVYRASSKAMWSVNDMFLTQAILSDLKGFGKTIDTASKTEIRESINRVERHIPNYRLPSRVIGSGEGGRLVSTAMGDPLFVAFGRYHYGMINSFANIAKNLTKGAGADRKEAIGQLMIMGALAYVVWPMIYKPIAQAVTGNEDATVRGRGPMGPISHVREMRETGDYGPIYRELVSFSPLISTAMDIFRNSDFGGNKIINPKDLSGALHGDPKSAARAAGQAGGYALQAAVSPVGTVNSALSNKNQGLAKGLRDNVMDIKNPSPGAQKWMHTQPRIQQRETVRRSKKDPNIGDKFLDAIGLD